MSHTTKQLRPANQSLQSDGANSSVVFSVLSSEGHMAALIFSELSGKSLSYAQRSDLPLTS